MTRCTSQPLVLARRTLAMLALAGVQAAGAQIPAAEFAARRDSLAARIDSGVVVAFGGHTPVSDFGPFYQLAAFHYLTNFDEPDAAFVMVARRGRGTSLLFVTPIEPRRAFYYGRRPDSAMVHRRFGIPSRPFSALAPTLDSLAAAGLPLYTLADFEAADFALTDHKLVNLRSSFADVFRASDWRSTFGVLRVRAVTEPIGA